MAPTRSILSVVALTLLVHGSADAVNQNCLKDQFYDQLCPDAERVIQNAVFAELDKNLSNAAAIIRLQFHDCFVGVRSHCSALLIQKRSHPSIPTSQMCVVLPYEAQLGSLSDHGFACKHTDCNAMPKIYRRASFR